MTSRKRIDLGTKRLLHAQQVLACLKGQLCLMENDHFLWPRREDDINQKKEEIRVLTLEIQDLQAAQPPIEGDR